MIFSSRSERIRLALGRHSYPYVASTHSTKVLTEPSCGSLSRAFDRELPHLAGIVTQPAAWLRARLPSPYSRGPVLQIPPTVPEFCRPAKSRKRWGHW